MHPEIVKLKSIITDYNISFDIVEDDFLDTKEYYKAVLFRLGDKSYRIYVDHEYRDLDLNVPELNLFLVLRELELADECRDYEEWCAEQMIENSEHSKDYYTDLIQAKNEIKTTLGSIDPIIGPLDFETNSGPIQHLRNKSPDY